MLRAIANIVERINNVFVTSNQTNTITIKELLGERLYSLLSEDLVYKYMEEEEGYGSQINETIHNNINAET